MTSLKKDESKRGLKADRPTITHFVGQSLNYICIFCWPNQQRFGKNKYPSRIACILSFGFFFNRNHEEMIRIKFSGAMRGEIVTSVIKKLWLLSCSKKIHHIFLRPGWDVFTKRFETFVNVPSFALRKSNFIIKKNLWRNLLFLQNGEESIGFPT